MTLSMEPFYEYCTADDLHVGDYVEDHGVVAGFNISGDGESREVHVSWGTRDSDDLVIVVDHMGTTTFKADEEMRRVMGSGRSKQAKHHEP